MYNTYVSRCGSVIFDFARGEIIFERAGTLSETMHLVSMKIKMSEITAIELAQPTFSKLGGFQLIVNGVRYVSSTGQDMTQFAITKKSEFPAMQWDLGQIVMTNGLGGFYDMNSVNAPKVLYQNVDPDVVYSFVNNTGSSLKVYKDYLVITHTGVLNYLSKNGLKGNKRFNFSSITAIECRKATTMAAGYLQFSIFGSDRSGGLNAAAGDENSILFDATNNNLIQEIVDYIERRRQEINQPQAPVVQQIVQQTSVADELKKFKELLDMGAITQEEYDAQKKRLLGM